MHIANFAARKVSSGFPTVSVPPIARGMIVSMDEDNGDLYVVWSASIGVVHAYPLHEERRNGDNNLRAAFSIMVDSEKFEYEMWCDVETRRHLPLRAVRPFSSETSDFVVLLSKRLRQIERREQNDIRSAYAA